MKKKLLLGHTSPETAFVLDDYPYGRRKRCKIRYWIESKKGHGDRFCSQTTNPFEGDKWNKPKASTYTPGFALMYQIDNPGADDHGHVKWAGISFWLSPQQWVDAMDSFLDQMSEDLQRAFCAAWRFSHRYTIGSWQDFWRTKGSQHLARRLTLQLVEDAFICATAATTDEVKQKYKERFQPAPADVTKWIESLPNP
jgi:hypothetical protein